MASTVNYSIRYTKELSVQAAPYVVTLKTGEKLYHSRLAEIRDHKPNSVLSIYDRRERAYLDLKTFWNNGRRKIVISNESVG